MTKITLSSLLAIIILTLSAGQTAMADGPDYNLKFTGTITSITCDIDTSSAEQTIHMGQFSTGQFRAVGSVSKFKAFNINLKNCTPDITGSKVWFTGIQDDDNPNLLKLTDTGMGIKNTLATGVGVEILDSKQSPIAINNNDSTVFALKAGTNSLLFYLHYKSTQPKVTAGNATAVMYFDLQYQ